ncbi:MAG TPA: OPT/YSL family transporter, partial [Planctomycetota bacterium]|nr:OPT/YSL family transporter [Planctomycetota bacterium]
MSQPAANVELKPFVSPQERQRELTLRGVAVGCLLGIVFAASSVYLGLKVGLTVSASIPIAVLSITLFKWFARALNRPPATILENNIVQTTGSAGESIAAGVAFTLPSLLLMGFDMELMRIFLVALFGGLIGVLMMIPLRHGLIVKEHGRLTYPEGTACGDVLIVGEQGGTSAKTVFLGFFVGLGYAFLNLIAKVWKDASNFALDALSGLRGVLPGATLGFEVSPPMLGVGYIIGPRVAANMMAGGALAFLVLIPLIHIFGDSMTTPMYPASTLIRDMSPGDIRNNYVLYVGA